MSTTPDPGDARATAPGVGVERVELRLALRAGRVVGLLALPVLVIATLARGSAGFLGALTAAAVVGGSLLMMGALLTWAARFGPSAMMSAALGGYLVRLVLYALLIVVLRPLEVIDGTSLAVSTVVLLLAALGWEAREVSRVPGYFALDTGLRTERTSG